ncbi:hypothetical protein JAAARDRAFT_68008 [Jaapia argillacea MUCL 33604]|uniref:Uncharacterized protein n=1 Tax=Jaapia argillacea MUCL 33604 TaxID=933084 RepID=A0A067QAG4_9AGAM|nr:hypothetical protein JAAARDRAFT_68008 [Jaapia argillacea MUCL 33604]
MSLLVHASRTWHSKAAILSLATRRGLHTTPALCKKKKQMDMDSLFPDEEPEATTNMGDLFGSATPIPPKPSKSAAQGASRYPIDSPVSTKPPRKRLTPEERLKKFNDLRQYVSDRIGKRRAIRREQIRDSAWNHLWDLASTKEQMEQVVEMFPAWKAMGKVFTQTHAEQFVRRCEELKCPTLALDVFSDKVKYGLSLTQLPTARRLLHSLHLTTPLSNTIALSALFSLYKLPPISKDLVSCSMLMSACYKYANSKKEHRDKQSALVVAKSLVPSLEGLLKKAKPTFVPVKSVDRARRKEPMWVKWSLKRVEDSLVSASQKTGASRETALKKYAWLREYRIKSRHITLGEA